MDLDDFAVNMALALFGSLLTLVGGWVLFLRQRKAQRNEVHRDAVSRLYLALAQVDDAEYQQVMSDGHSTEEETKQIESAVREAKDALSHALNRYVETWSGEDVSIPRKVQVMCSYLFRPVFARKLGTYNPAELAGHVIDEIANHYPHLGHLRPTDDDRKAVQTLLDHSMGGPDR